MTWTQWNTSWGFIYINSDGTHIKEVTFDAEDVDAIEKDSSPLSRKAAIQLEEYFQGKRCHFSLPLDPHGTEFQRKVWEETRNIAYGRTKTYGEIARAIGNPRASRAVGQALHRNPLLILVPCHRVIGKDGSLTGFGGGLHLKKKLLCLENLDNRIEKP